MKSLICGVLFLLSTVGATATVQAATMQLEWDPSPSAEQIGGYNVYVDGVKTTSTKTTSADVTVNPGTHSFYVTAFNDWGESVPSNVITTPPVAGAVKNLKKIVITIAVE